MGRGLTTKVASPWMLVRPSWCFTATAYDNKACHSHKGYLDIFKSRLTRAATSLNLTIEEETSNDFCDHYSKLEYTISQDTSGICGY